MSTYNHAFTIAFTVDGSKYEDPADCLKNESDKVMAGILRRTASLLRGEDLIDTNTIEPFDTYEEEV
jgi:hypothetical protein